MKNTIRIKVTVASLLLTAVFGNYEKKQLSKMIANAIKSYNRLCPYTLTPQYFIERENETKYNLLNKRLTDELIHCVTKAKYQKNKITIETHLCKRDTVCQITIDKNEFNEFMSRTDVSALDDTSDKTNISLSITYALEFMLYYRMNPDKFPECGKLFNLPGSKWNKDMISEVKRLSASKKFKYLIDPFGGALGLTMNIEAEKYIICESDPNKINLYNCLKYQHYELMRVLKKYNMTKEQFDDLKDLTLNPNPYACDVQAAAAFLFVSISSWYSKMQNYNPSFNPKNLLRRINLIYAYHDKLKNAKIVYVKDSNRLLRYLHLLRLVLNPKDLKKSLLVADPPYLSTSKYYFWRANKYVTFNKEEHTRLAEVVQSYENFLYFYRDNDYINKLFKKSGLYGENVELKNNHSKKDGKIATERIISNFKAEGLQTVKKLLK